MVSLAIQSIQELTAPAEAVEDFSGGTVLRRLFNEKPRLRRGMRPHQIEALISEYGGDQESSMDDVADKRMIALIFLLCIFAKGICLTWCMRVAKSSGSEIAKTLALDSRNDIISNSACLCIMVLASTLEAHGQGGSYIAKIDPAASLLLSIWIVYGWLCTALEQVTLLSNRRADTTVVEAVSATARKSLDGGPLELCGADVYHSGEGYEASLDVCPRAQRPSQVEPDALATALEALDAAVRAEEGSQIHEVHARLRPSSSRDNSAVGGAGGGIKASDDLSWASGYSAMAQPPQYPAQMKPQ